MANKKIPVINPKGEILTREKFQLIFEDVKDLIKSTAKGTENVLRKDVSLLGSRLDATQFAVTKLQDGMNEVKTEMRQMETRLSTEMRQIETRLSDRIDKYGGHIDDHEVRITALESGQIKSTPI